MKLQRYVVVFFIQSLSVADSTKNLIRQYMFRNFLYFSQHGLSKAWFQYPLLMLAVLYFVVR